MCVKTDVSIYTAGFMILKKKRMTLSWPYQFLKLNSLTGDTETGKLSRSELSRLLSLKQVPAVDQTAYPLQTSVASLATDWWMEPWPPAWFLEIYIELHVTGSLHTHTLFCLSIYLLIYLFLIFLSMDFCGAQLCAECWSFRGPTAGTPQMPV